MIAIGICSYKSAERLKRVVDSIDRMTVSPFRLLIWHNSAPGDDDCLKALDAIKCERTVSANVGYAGAVNGLLQMAREPHFAYCDNDIEIRIRGWDQRFIEVLQHEEVGQVFPGAGHYGFFNGRYHECLWNAGYCWMLRYSCLFPNFRYPENVSGVPQVFDCSLGHHEEVDFMIRLRLAGFQIACCPDVDVWHEANSTGENPEDHKPGGRIHDGVVRWMNKWNRYFCGDALKYSMTEYDPRALRYTDWPPCALYLERWTLAQFPEWNISSREELQDCNDHLNGYRIVKTNAGEMDAIEILKPKGYYRGRAI